MSSSSSTAAGHAHSRTSTPATDVSPPRTPEFVLPPPSEETLRRRAQSDRASNEIGVRMLKGWALLSDECVNNDCWAIPLVRPPRARPGAQPDPRKECVICGTVYITGDNGELVAQRSSTSQTAPTPSSIVQDTRETTSIAPIGATRTVAQNAPRELPASVISQVPVAVSPLIPAVAATFNPAQYSAASNPFSSAAQSLQGALDSLSLRLTQLTTASNLEVKQVKDAAEAMDTVMRSLHTARQLSGNT